jgi:starch-binding outer membrane protein, SusD/RagB family
MKRIKNYYIIGLVLVFFSCQEDYLNFYPKDSMTEGNFYNSMLQLQQAVDNVYWQLGRIYSASSLPDLYGELRSDNTNIYFPIGGSPVDDPISEFRALSNNTRFLEAWNETYNAIYICNNAIHHLQNTNIEIDQALKNRMIAEVTLMRALFYFNLVRAWGNVPLVVTKVSPAESYNYSRESAEKVYEQIITDLTLAKTNLPEAYTGNNVGRVTKYAASAILAKVYLTLNNTASARTELEFIINSGRYSLDANGDGVVNFDDFKHLFAPNTKNSKSSILEVQYLAGQNANNSNHQAQYTPYHVAFNLPGTTGAFRGGGKNSPTNDLANEFEPGDPRKEISIVPGYVNQLTGLFVVYPYTMKFYDPNYLNAGQNFEIIRYADILLMYAEVTGDPQYLNMVRARVGLPLYGTPGYPSDLYPTLALAIEHERRVELCFEFHRFFDLVRTGRAIEVMQSKGYDITPQKLLFPIPDYVIDVSPRITQNPGW